MVCYGKTQWWESMRLYAMVWYSTAMVWYSNDMVWYSNARYIYEISILYYGLCCKGYVWNEGISKKQYHLERLQKTSYFVKGLVNQLWLQTFASMQVIHFH